jgi:hypothetical protein
VQPSQQTSQQALNCEQGKASKKQAVYFKGDRAATARAASNFVLNLNAEKLALKNGSNHKSTTELKT